MVELLGDSEVWPTWPETLAMTSMASAATRQQARCCGYMLFAAPQPSGESGYRIKYQTFGADNHHYGQIILHSETPQ